MNWRIKMLKHFKDVMNDADITLKNFYDIAITTTAKEIKERKKKLDSAIAYLGDKYVLANPVKKMKKK
jgi:hypothetical protein